MQCGFRYSLNGELQRNNILILFLITHQQFIFMMKNCIDIKQTEALFVSNFTKRYFDTHYLAQ